MYGGDVLSLSIEVLVTGCLVDRRPRLSGSGSVCIELHRLVGVTVHCGTRIVTVYSAVIEEFWPLEFSLFGIFGSNWTMLWYAVVRAYLIEVDT